MRFLRLPAIRAIAAFFGILMIGCVYNADHAFFQWGTHRDMLRQVSVFGILSCGMTIVIVTGGIDLAVGSILALAAVVFAKLSIHWHWSGWLAVPTCVAIGALCGGAAGAAIARFRIQPFVATLAMMVFARGLAKAVSEGQKVSRAVPDADGNITYVDTPGIFAFLNSKVIHQNIAVVTIVFLLCVIICWFILRKFRLGRYLYAIGGNEEASRLSGVPVGMTKMIAYGLSGALAAVAGICQAAQEEQGDPEAGISYELTAIAMVVIGGTSLNGGRGSIWLTLLGALTIGYLDKILSINGVAEPSRLMLTGVIIIGAVLFQKSRN
jgi:ribose transport system permease protein